MNETKFNAELRAVLRVQGLQALHIREADQPGVSDLVVWRGRALVAWLELKIDDHEVEPQQEQFQKDRLKEGAEAYIVRLIGVVPSQVMVARYSEVYREFVTIAIVPDFYKEDWAKFFKEHRRVIHIAEQS